MSQVHPDRLPAQDPVRLPLRMKATLELYRKRVWMVKLAEGVLAAIFGLALSYLLVFGLDRLGDTSALLRAVILAVGSVGMVILFPLKYHNWVWSHQRLDQVARLLRYKFPHFGDHLLGIVELAHADSQQGASRALVEAAMQQADEELEKRDLSDAVPHPRHRRWAWTASVPLLVTVVVIVLTPAAGKNALWRWLMPWREIERYTFAQLESDAGLRVVPYAEPFEVRVQLKEESLWRPDSGSARFQNQQPVVAPRDGIFYRFQIPPQTEEGQVALRVGDARRGIPVAPKMRPALTALVAQVDLPAYLQRSEPMIADVRGGAVALVQGSSAVLQATASRDLEAATLNERPQQVTGRRVTTERIAVETTREYRLMWRDCFQLDARQPQIVRVEATLDAAPTIGFNQLENNRVVLSTEVLAFELQANDDFGVQTVGLEWEGIADPVHNPEPSQGEKLVAAGAPDNETLTAAATFSATREQVRPQSLRLRAFAEDYLPDRQRTYSPYVILHVLTPAEHLKWLTDQLAQWADASEEVYDKELQLHQTNKALMELPPEVLDDPAQKKKIQSQAAAEKANAAKLSALIDSGEKLVQEATKNEEFDPQQLDALAELLKKLEEIAGQQMPSVAELLAAAAAAPGQPANPPTESPLPGEPGEATQPAKPSETPPENSLAAPPGGKDLGLEKAKKYGPEALHPEGLDETPEDPNTPGGEVNVDKSKQPEGEPGYVPANPTPLVADFESNFNKPEPAEDAPQIVGGLGIPVTVLKGSGKEPAEGDQPEATTAELVIEAVSEQQELLDAFAKLSGEINKLLMGFENSTFVKRLKAASRQQIDLSVELNELDGFGTAASEPVQPARQRLADREVAAAEVLVTLQEDISAYADRKPSPNYTRVLQAMQNEDVAGQLREIAAAVTKNAVGQSTIDAEFWADTLDRWAEELVDPLGDPPPPAEGLIELPNLTPEIVLEVLRIINREIQLREETRELHQAVGGLEQAVYQQRGLEMSKTQSELASKSRELVEQIKQLPKQDHPMMQKTIKKLTDAAEIMDEVVDLLAVPQTDAPTVAAIQEVIETLLETARIPNAPMIVKAPPATAPALLLMGIGNDERKAAIEKRSVNQSTGKTGRKLPEEYRQGLDLYLNVLEGKEVE
ncbi:MAG: hypothetical protein VX346_10380 [Planctomycetota bacterium]|nr:hypothetical protein [Planctomycetota bacterium]